MDFINCAKGMNLLNYNLNIRWVFGPVLKRRYNIATKRIDKTGPVTIENVFSKI